jgi:hypothetical protein
MAFFTVIFTAVLRALRLIAWRLRFSADLVLATEQLLESVETVRGVAL